MYLTFDDVLIKPQFSEIKSRKDVSLASHILSWEMDIPVISSNMDTITGVAMTHAMKSEGAQSCLHRFWSIDDNVDAFMSCPLDTAVSIGLGDKEKERTEALLGEKAYIFIIDVAHGAQQRVVDQLRWLKRHKDIITIVGNFASGRSVKDFLMAAKDFMPDAVKVGIGSGAACTTRLKTGCGMPQISALLEVKSIAEQYGVKVIADGGLRTPGDIAKALAAGANAVMVGRILAGTDEALGMYIQDLNKNNPPELLSPRKAIYRGSASKESYIDQGKDDSWRTAEGEAYTVQYQGSVKKVLQDIEGGLRSAFTYVGARTLKEFQEKAELIQITNAGAIEGTAHGKS